MKNQLITKTIRCELKNNAYTITSQDYSYPDHLHDFFEICILLDGDITFITDNEIHHLEKNNLILIPPFKFHHAFSTNKLSNKRIILWFDVNLSNDLFSKNHILNNVSVCDFSKNIALYNLIQSFLFLLENIEKKHLLIATEGFLNNLIFQMNYSKPSSINSETIPPFIQSIIEYIDSNLNKKLQLKNIANHFNISIPALEKNFRSTMHISLINYYREKQLLNAKKLIIDGAKPTEVCFECGYSDYSSFYKSFVKEFGCSPKDIKKE